MVKPRPASLIDETLSAHLSQVTYLLQKVLGEITGTRAGFLLHVPSRWLKLLYSDDKRGEGAYWQPWWVRLAHTSCSCGDSFTSTWESTVP